MPDSGNGDAQIVEGPAMTVLITGGVVVDATGERRADVQIDGDRIAAVGVDLSASGRGAETLDATGCVVAPGFVDLHTHLREPGHEEAETIETGSRAAALGGYTAVVAMPNTDPAADSRAVVDFVRDQGRRAGLCDVHPSGCITVGRQGEMLAPFGELVAAGVRVFTDDGVGVQDPLLMRRAMEYSTGLDMVLAQHCEVAALTNGAVMHEGHCCSELGLPGWPAVAEELMVHRDIELARITGARLHILHVSTARSVELIRAAKADGLPVTAEATPHHLSLTDEALRGYDATFKVNPPLRTPARRRGGGRRARRRDDRRHRHRPRTAPGRPQGAPARRGAAGDGRAGDGARGCPPRAHRGRDVAGRCRRGAVSGSRPRSRDWPTTAGRSSRAVAPTSWSSTPTRSGRSCRPASPAAAATRRTSAGRCAAACATPSSPVCQPSTREPPPGE